MKNIHTQDQIDGMRKRLYARGAEIDKKVRHELSDNPVDVSRDWASSTEAPANTSDLRTGALVGEEPSVEIDPAPEPKRGYRKYVLIGSLFIFVLLTAASSLFMLFGGNSISNENILISINGPSLVGGGEVVPLQIAVSNQNTVSVESAVLIVKYPDGTRSTGNPPRNLYEERIPLKQMLPGEVRNIPLEVVIFGEENSEKNIDATVEYRIEGSNGTFFKESEPLAFRIGSTPLVIRIDSVEKVASGQTVDIVMTAVSNAPTVLNNIIISADYPNGFTFESSSPEPVYGQNVWRIDEILPEESKEIILKGVVNGLTEEEFRINFTSGPADPDNQFSVGSTLADARADFVIERPFIKVGVSINETVGKEAIISQGQVSGVKVDVTNTLDETVYDMAIEVVPNGNALDKNSIKGENGFFDSNTGNIRWEVANNESFERVLPGDTRTLVFAVNQGSEHTTASFDLVVNVYARRIAESSAVETLIGTAEAKAKYSSVVKINSQAERVSGPVPPKVGEETVYKMTLVAEAGANDVTNSIVETALPVYVNWFDVYTGEGEVTYNSVSKKLQWAIGDISEGRRKDLTFEVSITPSTSQIDQTPVLIKSQELRANDRFTGALLQNAVAAVTTELSAEMGYDRDNGEVVE